MEHAQVAEILNTLARHMEPTPNHFDHTILVNTKTDGGFYRLTRAKKAIVHPDRIASGVLLDVIISDLFEMVEAKNSLAKRQRDKDIKVYKKSAKEALGYLRKHMTPLDFQVWIANLI